MNHSLLSNGLKLTCSLALIGLAGALSQEAFGQSAADSSSRWGPGYNKFGARLIPPEWVRNVNEGVQPLNLLPNGKIQVGQRVFNSWTDYYLSDLVQGGRKCGSSLGMGDEMAIASGTQSDCSANFTNPSVNFDPAGNPKYRIPVVVHVIRDNSGTQGNLSASLVQSQITVLNEDYLAMAGTNGANGYNAEIRFYLATVDPNGNPTTGITFDNNTSWFNDSSSNAPYHSALAWNPQKYLNIYSLNLGASLLGFATIPQLNAPPVGNAFDGVHIHWTAFGRPGLGGAPYNLGRTCTHEVGHYMGLFHTFEGGCGTTSSPGCYSSGDRICDTNATAQSNFGCPFLLNTCGDGVDNVRNYMDYTDDSCLTNFTTEQSRRMRCTLENWRIQLYEIFNPAPVNDNCASATNASVGSTPFTTISSSTDGPDEPALCNVGGYTQIGNDVWFKWLAACTGNATISLCGSSYNAKMAVYIGCPSSPNSAIACNDNFCGSSPSITLPVNQGTLYRIRIGGFNNSTGTGTMVISCVAGATGACCVSGSCAGVMSQTSCTNQGGTYKGDNTTCGNVSCAPPCPADLNLSGTVNIDDLLIVINGWGACAQPCPPNCLADISHDCTVNVDDLLGCINGWGNCPQ
jgi:hypothetical protein